MLHPSRLLIAVLASLLAGHHAFAKGGNMRSEDRYDPQHFENLPPELRHEILRLCPAPKALHDFASYSERLQKIVLHFERLYCASKPFCRPAGCLHQSYISTRGHYHLIESYYAVERN